MQSGWRLYAVMVGLAALTGTVVALALSGGPRLPSESPRRESPSATASASPTRSPSSAGLPTPTAAPSESPSPVPTSSDPLARIRPLVFAWRPTETTAVVEKLQPDSATRLVAVPLSAGSSAQPLVELPSGTQWHLRLDGSAIAVTLSLGTSSLPRTRIAALNFQTGALGWVTPDEPLVSQRTPRWSNDGTVLYYSRVSLDGLSDLGIYRIRVDGSNLTQLRPPGDRPADVVGLTPDGLGLVLSLVRTGGSLDILDLNTRVTRTFGNVGGATIAAWRLTRPRALVAQSPTAGRIEGDLSLWDDVPATIVRTLVTQSAIFGADWDPTGTRLVVAMSAGTGNTAPQLVTMDVNGQSKTTLGETEGASNPYWLRAGIVYLSTAGLARPTEVRLAQPTGTAAPRTLFTDTDIVRLTYVTP